MCLGLKTAFVRNMQSSLHQVANQFNFCIFHTLAKRRDGIHVYQLTGFDCSCTFFFEWINKLSKVTVTSILYSGRLRPRTSLLFGCFLKLSRNLHSLCDKRAHSTVLAIFLPVPPFFSSFKFYRSHKMLLHDCYNREHRIIASSNMAPVKYSSLHLQIHHFLPLTIVKMKLPVWPWDDILGMKQFVSQGLVLLQIRISLLLASLSQLSLCVCFEAN